MKPVLVICLCVAFAPAPTAQVQPPRDTPPPVVEQARRERELRVAAEREPTSALAQHQLGAFLQDLAKHSTVAAVRLNYIREGIAAEDRALALQPDYADAMAVKNLLLRLQANVSFAGFAEPFEDAVARLQPVRVGGGVKVPTKVKDVKPAYPEDAKAAGVQGVVIIEALIGADGKVENARVLRSIPLLNDAALGAVSQWAFTPTEVNGVPWPVIMTVTVNFTLME